MKSYKRLLHETNRLKEGGAAWERNIKELRSMIKSNPTIKNTLQELTK